MVKNGTGPSLDFYLEYKDKLDLFIVIYFQKPLQVARKKHSIV